MSKSFLKRAVAAACISTAAMTAPLTAHAVFDIVLVFGGGLSPSEQTLFAAAETFWESVITGYAPGVLLTGITITATGAALDGFGGVLGSAGPSNLTFQGSHFYATTGNMQFDTADIPSLVSGGTFDDVVRHEMGHVLGFGTLWAPNNVYVDGSGRYTGINALASYQTEYNLPLATFVPIELGGGQGTMDGHWDEVNGGGTNTGILDLQGRDKRFEMMTGWLDTPAHVSNTTVESFRDIGYTVNVSAVPEPAAILLLLAGIPMVSGLSARRRRQAIAKL